MLVERRLRRIEGARLTIVEPDGETTFGDPQAERHVSIYVDNPRFYSRLALGGGLGASESLMDGDWRCDDLVGLVRIFIANMDIADHFERGLAWSSHLAARAGHWLRQNTRSGARRNIRAHYDVGNDFFRLFLDETLSYSSGIFDHDRTTMQAASLAKLDRVGQKLALTPNDHLLEIGTGWGGLAVYLAEKFGCRVTTTTISAAQHQVACERVRAAGLSDRVTVLLKDYRDLTGEYDKLVSIEMIEAIGHENFSTYFATCSQLLKPSGTMFLQAITIREQRYREHLRSVDFIRKYIFPGGCLPSVTALMQAITTGGNLRPVHLEDIAGHYVLTLQAWREKFWQNIERVRTLGYDERFVRMWDYYLAYCEAAFAERQVGNVQMLLAKPGAQLESARFGCDLPDAGRA